MVRNEIGARPNKYWPIVVGVIAICLFGFLILTNQQHATNSGDNIHRFSNGGSYKDGNKQIAYNPNNPRAYNGVTGGKTFNGVLVSGLLAAIIFILWLQFTTEQRCSPTCRGECKRRSTPAAEATTTGANESATEF